MPTLTTAHPSWCIPNRCDITNQGGAHRGQLHTIDGPDTTILTSLWQSTIGRPRVLLTAGGRTAVLDLAQANLAGNQLCDLVAQAGK